MESWKSPPTLSGPFRAILKVLLLQPRRERKYHQHHQVSICWASLALTSESRVRWVCHQPGMFGRWGYKVLQIWLPHSDTSVSRPLNDLFRFLCQEVFPSLNQSKNHPAMPKQLSRDSDWGCFRASRDWTFCMQNTCFILSYSFSPKHCIDRQSNEYYFVNILFPWQ